MRSRFAYLLVSILALGLTMAAQIQPIPNLSVQPIPIRGGDLVLGYGIANAFVPGPAGQTPPYDPIGADPQVITNFKGLTAMGYTSGFATDNKDSQYVVITDIRVYQGKYIGGTAADPVNTAGATASEEADGIFVEIWLDLWDLGLRTQLHDFSPWTLPNGLFWTVKVDPSSVKVDGDTVTIHLVDVPVVDAFSFPPPQQAVPGISPIQLIPAKLSLDITYRRTGNPRRVRPTSYDLISPFNWAGTMWDSSNSGTFSLSYDDGSFSASGSFDSGRNFGEMGFERNGVFLRHDEWDDSEHAKAQPESLPLANAPTREITAKVAGSIPDQNTRTVLLKGRAPVKVNF